MTGQIGGPLLVGASTSIAEFMLPRILGEFKSQYPNVKPRLIVANSESIETRVAEHTLDIGLIEAPSHQGNLQCEICCDDELLVVCAPGSPLAKNKELTPQLLATHPFVSREPGSGTREVTDNYFRSAGVPPESLNIVIELGSPEAIKGVVETGIGFAIVSRASVAKEKRLGDLLAIPLKPRLTRTLSMVYPKEKFRSRLVNTFVEFATAKLKQFAAKQG
jgi:DNA-binding transcriptional LysR family regulator